MKVKDVEISNSACDPGQFWNNESQGCEECLIGQYSERTTAENCTDCPGELTTQYRASNSSSLCGK